MLILCGKTASGKSTLAKELEKRGMHRIITYTTRPMRESEKDGVDYHFIPQARFNALRRGGFFAETANYNASFGFCSYGSAKDDYKDDKAFVILNPYGVRQILNSGVEATVLYIMADDDLLIERLKKRGDDEKEITRRLKADKEDFADMEDLCTCTVSAKLYDGEDGIEKLADAVKYFFSI